MLSLLHWKSGRVPVLSIFILNNHKIYAKLNSAKLIEYNITSIISKGVVFPFVYFLLYLNYEFDKNANSDDMSAVMLVILN